MKKNAFIFILHNKYLILIPDHSLSIHLIRCVILIDSIEHYTVGIPDQISDHNEIAN